MTENTPEKPEITNNPTNLETNINIQEGNFSDKENENPNKVEINKDDFSTEKKANIFAKLCKNNEVTKRAFIEKVQTDFKDFSLGKEPTDKNSKEYKEYKNQILQLQTYGKVYFDETIIIDGIIGDQTRIIIESLQNHDNFSPEIFSNKIATILDQKKYPKVSIDTRKKIKEKLLQQTKGTIGKNNANQEQRLNYAKESNDAIVLQIFGYFYLNISIGEIDGLRGPKTKDIQAILKWGDAKTEVGKKRQENHKQCVEEIQQYQERKKEYLNTEPSNTPKSMSETSILDIRGNESLNTFLSTKGEQNPITHENITQRHQEGQRAVIAEELKEMLTKNQIKQLMEKLFVKEGKMKKKKEDIHTLLKTFNKNEDEIKKITEIIHRPNHDKIKQYVQNKIFETTKEKRKNIKSINNVLTTIKNFLNITTNIELKNFQQDFHRNPSSSENLNINQETITISGEITGQPKTPITFRYDMGTGDLCINSVCQEKEGILKVNNTDATTKLWNIWPFENLSTISPKEKNADIELYIEKNRTLTYLTESFDIATKKQYDEANSKGIMHLFRILEKSLTSPNECRLLRENLTRLNKLIGKEDVKQNWIETTEKKAESQTDDKPLHQQDEKMLDNLSTYFNTKKRETDLRQLNTSEDSSNGIYTFLREFTTNIDEKAPTNHNENQRLDLNKMSTHLSALEQKKAEQDLITHYRKITEQERINADKELDAKLETWLT